MNALILSPTIYNGVAHAAGELVDIDSTSFENLRRKGRVTAATEDAEPQAPVNHAPRKRVVAEPK